MSTYTAQVFRDSDQWVIEVPELDFVGQTRTLASAADTARRLIALRLDVNPAGVDVVMDYSRVDPDAVALAANARAGQARAKELARQAAAIWGQAARRLVHDDNLSVRDAAAVLGVSFSRVQQLVKYRAS
jgi:hypothetical protein